MVPALLLVGPALPQHEAIEAGLPAHLLWLSADRLRKEGYELRPDVFVHLSNAAAAALSDLRSEVISRTAKRLDDAATTVLRDLSFNDPRDGIMSCAMLTLKLVDEGLYRDPTNQAVLVSTHLSSDAQDGASELPFNEAILRRNVGRLLVRLNLLGYYQRIALSPTPT